MKALKSVMAVLLLCALVLCCAGCGKKDMDDSMNSDGGSSATANATLEDGEYEAHDTVFDDQGYRDTVKITVRDGKVYSITCDAESKDGGTKKEHSESGKYNMKAGGAQYDWHEEIAFFERYVTEKGVESVNLKSDGKTDTVTGCTIAVKNYVKLINEAVEKAKSK